MPVEMEQSWPFLSENMPCVSHQDHERKGAHTMIRTSRFVGLVARYIVHLALDGDIALVTIHS